MTGRALAQSVHGAAVAGQAAAASGGAVQGSAGVQGAAAVQGVAAVRDAAAVQGAAAVQDARTAGVEGEVEPGLEIPTAAERLGLAFKGAMAAIRRLRGRETHRPGELSYAQYGLLFGLAGCGGGMSARELADAADLSPATVTQMLDSLAASGLVERVRSVQDRRVVTTSLTERGVAVVEQRRSRLEPRWRAALEEFTDDELLVAVRVLNRLRDMFEEYALEGAHEVAQEPPGA